ncbi:Deoxyribonuclease [Streptococcus gordonii]|uniref:Deoxyribonuclease n=1 Tax=Streptococcus gordonii TaxID=1302 RepID=A0A139N5E5_STRGN|nr:Deoxyribonuclease [Streptococcus gordonii]
MIYRIGLVQNAINIRAQQAAEAEQARQETARLAAEQQQTRIVYVARNGTADVYWYSMENMPSNTRFDRVVSMTEADAIASGKRHTSKE